MTDQQTLPPTPGTMTPQNPPIQPVGKVSGGMNTPQPSNQKMSPKVMIGGLVALLLVAGIGVGIFLTKQSQDLRQQAAVAGNPDPYAAACTSSGGPVNPGEYKCLSDNTLVTCPQDNISPITPVSVVRNCAANTVCNATTHMCDIPQCPNGSSYSTTTNMCECQMTNGLMKAFPVGGALPVECRATCSTSIPGNSCFVGQVSCGSGYSQHGTCENSVGEQGTCCAPLTCSSSSDSTCMNKAPGTSCTPVGGGSGLCSGTAGASCTCQPTATIAPGACNASSDSQCVGKTSGSSCAMVGSQGSGLCQLNTTGSCVCQATGSPICSGTGTVCLSGAQSCASGFEPKTDNSCSAPGVRCCPASTTKTCWSNACQSISYTGIGCPTDYPHATKPTTCGGGGTPTPNPTCTQPGVACSTATSDNGNCCAGSYCQGPAGSQRCETPTGDVCPGGGVCGSPQGYIAIKCPQLTNGECLENPSTFDSYTAARTYAGTCGQVDTTCVGGTNNRHLCGAFEIISSGCSGGGGSPGPSPTPGVTPTPGPICASIASSNPAPQVGDTVKFTCGLVNGAEHYEFRVKTPAGTIQTLAADVTSPSKNVSQSLLIDTAGSYSAQCRICTGATTCQAWETL